MFCIKCGKKLPDDAKFCSLCGSPVDFENNEEYDNEFYEDEQGEDIEDDDDITIVIDNETVNLTEIITLYGSDKESAIKHLIRLTDIGSWEAKDIIDDAFVKIYGEQNESTSEPKKGFWAKVKEHNQALADQYQADAAARKERLAQEAADKIKRLQELDRNGIAYCPKCHSTSLTAHKKGFGVGKAVIGAVVAAPVFAPIGLVAGNMGAKKVRVTCMKCGHQFWAGQKR